VECRVSVPTLRALLLFLYGTGLRIGEALRLRLADVDMRNAVITIRGTKSAQLRTIKAKRSTPRQVCYLEKPEIDALLDAPSLATKLGYRDRALLPFLYNSGARADEAANVCIDDLSLHSGSDKTLSSVRLHGKGGKVRICPLWASTTEKLKELVASRSGNERVFLNHRSEPLTRFGIYEIVTRNVRIAMKRVPEMRKKRVGPHTIRHTTATHLLRAGVDINTIRAWLGHVSINTTNIYAETDLDMKAKALDMCAVNGSRSRKHWRDNPDLMSFLAKI
jgi:integrase/recombinase XerD